MILSTDALTHPERPDELTPTRILVLTLYSSLIWFVVAQYIHYGGAAGDFIGQKAIFTYIATFLLTLPLNWFARTIVGMPAEKMLSVASLGLVVPPTLEGIVMHWFPGFYGGDPAIIGEGAVWLLFAIGIGIGLALLTTLLANKRLHAGDRAPAIAASTTKGTPLTVPGSHGEVSHVQFLRFAGCPVCNLMLQSYIKRNAELRAAGIREVILFHSDAKHVRDYHEQLPFDVIADPHQKLYRLYKVEKSALAILSPAALPNLIRGYRLKPAGHQDSTPFGLPAEFLIAADGTILACHYAAHSSDQWTVDDVLDMARGLPLNSVQPDFHAGELRS
jgi:peroxiredoxin